MADIKVNVKNKRRIWLAVMFSLIMPGLGQVYCGKLARGLVLNFLNILPLPIIIGLFLVSSSPALMQITISLILAGGIIQLIAIIDSACIAKRTKSDYELKDYNNPAVYVLLVLIVTGGCIGSGLYFREQMLEAFRIPKDKASMYPTIEPGDRFLASKIAYKNSDPKRGDVVVFIYPRDRRFNHIKRVIAVAGDTVEIKNNDLYVNGQKLERTSLGRARLHKPKTEIDGEVFLEKNEGAEYKIFLSGAEGEQQRKSADFAQMTVSEDHCFVLGDNRNSSEDSRHFGPLHLGLIKGRADYLYWPAKDWSRFGRID